MRSLWTLLALAIILGVGGYKARSAWRQHLWREAGVLVHLLSWASGMLGISLFLTPVYLAVDGWTGLNNLAWLLAYLLLLPPAYLVGVQISGGFPARGGLMRRLLKAGMVATPLLLTLLYAVWIRPSPEWPQRTARSLPEMLFILLFFAAISSLPSLALALILSSFRRKGNLLFRLRVSVSGVATVAALVCFGSKMAGAVIAYGSPGSPLVGQLDRVAWTAMGMAALAWLVSMLPNRVFEATVGPVLYVAKLRTLHALRRLYARLLALSSPVVSPGRAQDDPGAGRVHARPGRDGGRRRAFRGGELDHVPVAAGGGAGGAAPAPGRRGSGFPGRGAGGRLPAGPGTSGPEGAGTVRDGGK